MKHGSVTLPILLSLLSGGCALLPTDSITPAPVAVAESGDPQQVVNKLRSHARILRYDGRYAEAIEHLDRAIALHPHDPELLDERTQTKLSWSRMRFELQDRLRLIQASARTERLPLLERLARADPADQILHTELKTLRRELPQDAVRLAQCGHRQADSRPDLARRCLRLSVQLADQREERELLAKLEKMPPPDTDRHAGKAKSKAQKADRQTPMPSPKPQPPELIKARQLMQDGKHFGAIRHLNTLRESGRDTPASRAMLAEAQAALADSSNALLLAGDRLYHQGRVKEALALWDAALTVDPYNQDARNKSERAARVLSNLKALDGETTAP